MIEVGAIVHGWEVLAVSTDRRRIIGCCTKCGVRRKLALGSLGRCECRAPSRHEDAQAVEARRRSRHSGERGWR